MQVQTPDFKTCVWAEHPTRPGYFIPSCYAKTQNNCSEINLNKFQKRRPLASLVKCPFCSGRLNLVRLHS